MFLFFHSLCVSVIDVIICYSVFSLLHNSLGHSVCSYSLDIGVIISLLRVLAADWHAAGGGARAAARRRACRARRPRLSVRAALAH